MRVLNIHWPIVIVITIVLYVLTIITLPFNSQTATIFLFALIAYWSRLPGVGVINPLNFLYYMDVVDIFSMLVAVYVGPMQAIFFTLFCNYATRAVGIYPHWAMVIKDGISQSMVCLVIPFVYTLLGGNITSTVIAYTLLRTVGFFLLWIVWRPWGLIKQLSIQISETAVALAINILYSKIFGNFISNLLQAGVEFNWVLFLFASLVVLFFAVFIVGLDQLLPKKETTSKIVKNVVRNITPAKPAAPDTHFTDARDIKKNLGL